MLLRITNSHGRRETALIDDATANHILASRTDYLMLNAEVEAAEARLAKLVELRDAEYARLTNTDGEADRRKTALLWNGLNCVLTKVKR